MEQQQIEDNTQYLKACVDTRTCAKLIIDSLVNAKFVPLDVFNSDVLGNLIVNYYPVYILYIGYHAHYTASVGYNRFETVSVPYTTYVNGTPVTHYRTESRMRTDWRPISGSVPGTVNVVVPATQVPDYILSVLHGVNINSEHLLSPQPEIKLLDVKGKELSHNDSFSRFGQKIVNDYIYAHVNQILPGDVKANVNVQWTYNYNYNLVFAPIFCSSYVYDGSTYRFILNGTNPDSYFFTSPQDQDKKRKAGILSFILCGLVLTCSILWILHFGVYPEKNWIVIVAGILSGLTLAFAFIVFYTSSIFRKNDMGDLDAIGKRVLLRWNAEHPR